MKADYYAVVKSECKKRVDNVMKNLKNELHNDLNETLLRAIKGISDSEILCYSLCSVSYFVDEYGILFRDPRVSFYSEKESRNAINCEEISKREFGYIFTIKEKFKDFISELKEDTSFLVEDDKDIDFVKDINVAQDICFTIFFKITECN